MQKTMPSDWHTKKKKKKELGRNETFKEIMTNEWFLKLMKHRLI